MLLSHMEVYETITWGEFLSLLKNCTQEERAEVFDACGEYVEHEQHSYGDTPINEGNFRSIIGRYPSNEYIPEYEVLDPMARVLCHRKGRDTWDVVYRDDAGGNGAYDIILINIIPESTEALARFLKRVVEKHPDLKEALMKELL